MSRWSHEHPDERADHAKTQARSNAISDYLKPAPRSLEDYRDWLYLERDAEPQRSARALDLTARIREVENEIGERAGDP